MITDPELSNVVADLERLKQRVDQLANFIWADPTQFVDSCSVARELDEISNQVHSLISSYLAKENQMTHWFPNDQVPSPNPQPRSAGRDLDSLAKVIWEEAIRPMMSPGIQSVLPVWGNVPAELSSYAIAAARTIQIHLDQFDKVPKEGEKQELQVNGTLSNKEPEDSDWKDAKEGVAKYIYEGAIRGLGRESDFPKWEDLPDSMASQCSYETADTILDFLSSHVSFAHFDDV